jgi:hypothetical protein
VINIFKITHKGNYYLFYEGVEFYLFLTIQPMPVDIIKFSQNNTECDITLMTYTNEYLLKIGYQRPFFTLMNIYIVKNENSRKLNLEEGQIKMITYPSNDNNITIYINLIDVKITNETYINLKIPSKKNEKLYISYSDKIYILNKTGINIHNINEESQMILNINKCDNITEDIPILIKLGIDYHKIQLIEDENKYEFNYGQYGVIKYPQDRKIKMKFKMSLTGISFNYYNIYLTNDFLNDTSNIISPELFNTIKITSKEYKFEIKTELEDLEREKNNLNNYGQSSNDVEELYLLFSFDGKVEVEIDDEEEDEDEDDSYDEESKTIYILIFSITIPLIIIIVIIILLIYLKKIRRKKHKKFINENIPLNQSYEKPTEREYGQITTTGNNNDYENNFNYSENNENNINIENSKISKINYDNSYDPSQPAPLPYNP